MNTKILVTLLIVVGIGIAVLEGVPLKAWQWVSRFAFSDQLLGTISSKEFLPGPLKGSLEAVQSNLTREGVISETNKHRSANGLGDLRMNARLNNAAEAKLEDMFNQQYFEHVSPQGIAPAEVISEVGYKYIVVGENLALGNFKDDATLVQAWMDSPGHRANILHGKFQEIGVAVRKGTYEGKPVWIAVQEFGTPLSACPNPSDGTKATIDANRNQIDAWQAELAQLKQKMETSRYASEEAYNADADRYNALASRTNALIEETRKLVEQYNTQVNSFNQCLEKNG